MALYTAMDLPQDLTPNLQAFPKAQVARFKFSYAQLGLHSPRYRQRIHNIKELYKGASQLDQSKGPPSILFPTLAIQMPL